MMSKEANIRAILECNFTGFKDEIIDTAVELICDLECEPITSPSQHLAKQAEDFEEIAMNEIDKARSCEDCISREEVKDKLMELWTKYMPMELDMHLSFVLEKISELPSVTPKARWIPCSERLPEREGWYLTSLGDKTYGGADVDMYCKGWDKYGTHVLAWMPLPQPYTESEDEE